MPTFAVIFILSYIAASIRIPKINRSEWDNWQSFSALYFHWSPCYQKILLTLKGINTVSLVLRQNTVLYKSGGNTISLILFSATWPPEIAWWTGEAWWRWVISVCVGTSTSGITITRWALVSCPCGGWHRSHCSPPTSPHAPTYGGCDCLSTRKLHHFLF